MDDTDAKPSGQHCTDSEPTSGTGYVTSPGSEQSSQNQNGGATVNVMRKYLYAEEYLMDHEDRGKALIINNTKFQAGLNDRQGSDVDASAMYSRFQDLGFDVDLQNDMSADKIIEELKKVAAEDHSNADCFACVLLTHGDAEGLYGSTGRITESDMMDCLNSEKCPTLAFKPKIFIFQACRGTKIDHGTRFNVTDPGDGNVMDASGETEEYNRYLALQQELVQTVKIPNDMNFLVCYASSDGKFANRHTERGSIYIQKLSEEMSDMKDDEDFLNVLTRVNQKVAIEFEQGGTNAQFKGMKQMPCFVSRLTKPLRFREK